MGSRTSIVNADTINVIGGGRVVESGPHRDLLREGGLYATLYNEQFEGGKVQWRCPDGDVLADGTIRQREAQSA
jgi:ATP-binding cassette, subfamily B, bacterial